MTKCIHNSNEIQASNTQSSVSTLTGGDNRTKGFLVISIILDHLPDYLVPLDWLRLTSTCRFAHHWKIYTHHLRRCYSNLLHEALTAPPGVSSRLFDTLISRHLQHAVEIGNSQIFEMIFSRLPESMISNRNFHAATRGWISRAATVPEVAKVDANSDEVTEHQSDSNQGGAKIIKLLVDHIYKLEGRYYPVVTVLRQTIQANEPDSFQTIWRQFDSKKLSTEMIHDCGDWLYIWRKWMIVVVEEIGISCGNDNNIGNLSHAICEGWVNTLMDTMWGVFEKSILEEEAILKMNEEMIAFVKWGLEHIDERLDWVLVVLKSVKDLSRRKQFVEVIVRDGGGVIDDGKTAKLKQIQDGL
ncbi:hypothetical protein HDU76_010958 [Blyttiomyces sp. JEL0837]|nr:hypothetical protein HDU76_010958 [Blyttiomyces sp. JEL0837]